MRPPLLFRHPPSSWRGFLLRVAVVAVAGLIVLGVADWLGILLDPFGLSPQHRAPYTQDAAPSRTPEP